MVIPTLGPIVNGVTAIFEILNEITGFITNSAELLILYCVQLYEYVQMIPYFITIVPIVIGVPLTLALILQMVKVVLYGG